MGGFLLVRAVSLPVTAGILNAWADHLLIVSDILPIARNSEPLTMFKQPSGWAGILSVQPLCRE
jgi:hypothetical protein